MTDLRTLKDGDTIDLWCFRFEWRDSLEPSAAKAIPVQGTFRVLGKGPEGVEATGALGTVALFQNAFPTRRALIESRLVRARSWLLNAERDIREMEALLMEEA